MSARAMAADARPFASLSSGLLARKGQARPAMRPQSYTPGLDAGSLGDDDLGWNDLGFVAPEPTDAASPAELPEVVRQQRELVAEFDAPQLPVVATVTTLPPVPVSRATGKPRTAFTLRLDPARHLKLRLACATRGLSAQKLLVAALDQLLGAMPDLDALAARFASPEVGAANPQDTDR